MTLNALAPRSSRASLWLALAPGLFVALWSTGFIGGKLALLDAPPLSFLALRFVIVTAFMLGVTVLSRAPWPRSFAEAGHIAVVGALLQGGYLGGVFVGISLGISAGLSALIVGLQPVLTAALARAVLGESILPRQWLGFVLGLVGVALVAASKLSFARMESWGVAATVLALLGITIGTLYQKRFCGAMDLRSGTVIQNGVAAVPMLVGAALFENFQVAWTGRFVFALAWVCLVLSIGATLLLFVLLRRGAAVRVASLFYLVPPVTALMAFLLFGETLDPPALLGMALAVTGVALVNRR